MRDRVVNVSSAPRREESLRQRRRDSELYDTSPWAAVQTSDFEDVSAGSSALVRKPGSLAADRLASSVIRVSGCTRALVVDAASGRLLADRSVGVDLPMAPASPAAVGDALLRLIRTTESATRDGFESMACTLTTHHVALMRSELVSGCTVCAIFPADRITVAAAIRGLQSELSASRQTLTTRPVDG